MIGCVPSDRPILSGYEDIAKRTCSLDAAQRNPGPCDNILKFLTIQKLSRNPLPLHPGYEECS